VIEQVGRPRIIPVGWSAWLVELPDESRVLPLSQHLLALRDEGNLSGVVDVVPGARTVLLAGDATGVDGGILARTVGAWDSDGGPTAGLAPLTEIAVIYDGEDLDDVARLTGLTHPRSGHAAHWQGTLGCVLRVFRRIRLPNGYASPAPPAET
jgi:allophanate hydrolase subunit 1